MLRLMRQKAQSWMIKILFAIIIVVFVFFYGYGRKTGKRTVIAEVNGTKITDNLFRSEYQKAYQNIVRLYQSVYQDRFDEAMIDRFTLRQNVLNDLINQTLLFQEAERLAVRLSPQELQAAVHSNPTFQVDGRFNQQRFMAVLGANRMDVEEFEEIEARNRLIVKLTDLVGLGGAEISDQEVLDTYTLENEKINLQFVLFNPTAYEGSVSADDQELEAYFSENSARFEMPPKTQAQYIVFSAEDFLKTVEVSQEEIREEYEYNLEEYRVPKRVKVSHILIKGNGDKGEEGTEDARKRAEEILDEAREKGDFAALAKKYSEDPISAKEGGSIGWVSKGEAAPEFVEVAFSLQKGEIGPLVESDDGFHIVKVTGIQEGRVKTLEEVGEGIRVELARASSRQMAEEECQESFFAVFETKDLESYAAEKGKDLKTTVLFSKDERLKELGGNLQFNNHAFSGEEDEVLSPLELGEKYYLVKVIKHQKARIPEFAEVREKVEEELISEKATDKAESLANEMLKELMAGKSLTEVASTKGLKLEETALFERGSAYVPKLGPTEVLGKEIFSLSPASPLLAKVVSYGKRFFVVQLKEEEKIDMGKFESEKEQYKKKLYADRRGQILSRWLESLRKNSEIEILEENLRF